MLEAVDYTDPDAPARFVKSLRDTGFGVLCNHPIQQTQVNAIYKNWLAFFSDERKSGFLVDPCNNDGFFPAQQAEAAKGRLVRDIKEYFHYYPWGQCPDDLRHELNRYYELVGEFSGELLSWIEEHSPDEVRAGYSESLPSMTVSYTHLTLPTILLV